MLISKKGVRGHCSLPPAYISYWRLVNGRARCRFRARLVVNRPSDSAADPLGRRTCHRRRAEEGNVVKRNSSRQNVQRNFANMDLALVDQQSSPVVIQNFDSLCGLRLDLSALVDR
jgi:hypothetical protein